MPGVIIPAPEGGLVVVHGRDADGNYVPLRCTPTGYLVVADFAPTGAQYVVLALHADLDNESLHSALTGADLHDPKAHGSSHEAGGSDAIAVQGLAGTYLAADTLANRPAAGTANRYYYATDTGQLFYDNGTSWVEITPTPASHQASHAGGGSDLLKYTRQILFFDPTDPIATGTDTLATIVYRGPMLTLVRWDMRCKTAPVGAAMIFDVNVGGTSLWATNQANRPTIADGATSGTGTAFDTTTLSDGDVLTIDYDQVGSTTAGGQVTLILEGEANPETG